MAVTTVVVMPVFVAVGVIVGFVVVRSVVAGMRVVVGGQVVVVDPDHVRVRVAVHQRPVAVLVRVRRIVGLRMRMA